MPLIKTCEALSSSPATTLLMGDSGNDASAFRAAGCLVIVVSHGYNDGAPVADVDSDAGVDRIDQL